MFVKIRLFRIVLLTAACLLGLQYGCGDEGIILAQNTKILDEATRSALVLVEENGTLHFDTTTSLLKELEVGDILVSQPAPAAPYGLLRGVLGIDFRDSGEVVVETRQALLTEAVEKGNFEFTRELAPEDLLSASPLQPGVVTRGLTLDLINVEINTDLGTGKRVTATGSLQVGPFVEISGDIGYFKMKRLHARVGIKGTAKLEINASASAEVQKRVELANYKFKTFTVFMGVFPVTVTPEITVYVDGEGSLSASLDFSVQEDVTLAAGFEYSDEEGVRDISEKEADFQKSGPTLNGQADIKAAVGLKFLLLLYGTAGPFGGVEAGPHFAANLQADENQKKLSWTFEGCLWINAGIEAEIVDFEYNKVIYEACSMFAQGEVVLPDGGVEGGNLVWLEVLVPKGEPDFFALDVSTTGKVVGYYEPPSFGQEEAVWWSPDGKFHMYQNIGDYYTLEFVAISADAATIVANGTPINPTTTHDWDALVWTGGETVTNLGVLVADGATEATDISADGAVVVGASWTSTGPGSVNEHAIYWTSSSGLQDLGTLGGNFSKATAVSGDGLVVVGISKTSDGLDHAFRWTAGQGMQLLDVDFEPVAVSGDGSVIVGPHNGGWPGYRWSVSEGVEQLDFFPLDISGDGNVVVGHRETVDTNQHAVRWTPDGGIENLNETYAHLLIDGSRLYSATAISYDGRYIVGEGFHEGAGFQPFLLDTEAGK